MLCPKNSVHLLLQSLLLGEKYLNSLIELLLETFARSIGLMRDSTIRLFIRGECDPSVGDDAVASPSAPVWRTLDAARRAPSDDNGARVGHTRTCCKLVIGDHRGM